MRTELIVKIEERIVRDDDPLIVAMLSARCRCNHTLGGHDLHGCRFCPCFGFEEREH